ncbi:MAG: aromatic amino acid lyase, partial [Bacteroidetes bacterium]|nr:aromatic amino acid lyase [Bacteroidota bacterium]
MIIIAKKALDLEDMQNLLFSGKKVGLDDAAMQKVEDNFKFLRNFSANKLIYGINTGFGPMAQYKVKEEHINALQYNLIRSHSSGAGNLLAPILVKSLMIARLNTLMLAYSGVHPELPHLLKELINKEIIPCIPEHGGVGASGDLVQLAHLALVLIGEGEVHYEGEILATSEVFYKLNIRPISIHLREGLAVMNGTSAMTGISLVNLITANRILKWAVILSAMSNEVVSAFDDHFSHELNSVKKHIGQNRIAEMLRTILSDSKMIRKRSEHFYNPANIDKDILEDKVQEYYSLRCVSQVLGPVLDTITNAENILVDELNSVNDNPVIDHVNQNVYHGGNFHGDYVSLEMDKLKIAITKLSMLSE